jgi:hypothetical protein
VVRAGDAVMDMVYFTAHDIARAGVRKAIATADVVVR